MAVNIIEGTAVTLPDGAAGGDQGSLVKGISPRDPSQMGFPHMLPVELALGEAPAREICESYNISKEQFAEYVVNPAFKKAYADAVESLKKDGMSFRIKARMQSEALLKTSWELIHAPHTPANVKADLIKSTMRVAGLEPKSDGAGGGTNLLININLG